MTSNTQEIAGLVRESLEHSRPVNNMTLTVDESGIVASQVGGKTWWRVPVVPSPWPDRLSSLYEALAEVEGDLQDKRGLDILLFAGDPADASNGATTNGSVPHK